MRTLGMRAFSAPPARRDLGAFDPTHYACDDGTAPNYQGYCEDGSTPELNYPYREGDACQTPSGATGLRDENQNCVPTSQPANDSPCTTDDGLPGYTMNGGCFPNAGIPCSNGQPGRWVTDNERGCTIPDTTPIDPPPDGSADQAAKRPGGSATGPTGSSGTGTDGTASNPSGWGFWTVVGGILVFVTLAAVVVGEGYRGEPAPPAPRRLPPRRALRQLGR